MILFCHISTTRIKDIKGAPAPSDHREPSDLSTSSLLQSSVLGTGQRRKARGLLKLEICGVMAPCSSVAPCCLYAGFPKMVGLYWTIPSKWMMTGGTPISGHLHSISLWRLFSKPNNQPPSLLDVAVLVLFDTFFAATWQGMALATETWVA